ncbi:MAG: hypothetical protein LBL69_04395, partial [Zoogloeaceae bacterium]|nr:hypothetical protein [Zoogloeaceae bacterium]
MDIWHWVEKLTDELEEAGQERAASLFFRFANSASDLNLSQAEALLPEVMALAKTLKNPWAEIFFRHWALRIRFELKGEGESALPDTVKLVDLAHSPDGAECPQSICSLQDIASCYARMDGAGWAEERRAVAREGLAKITPEWNCFGCLSIQYANAFADEGRFEEALAAYDEYCQAMAAAGQELLLDDPLHHARYLLLLGRHAEALASLDKALEHPEFQDHDSLVLEERLLRARVLASMGKAEESMALLPPWNDLLPAFCEDWLRAAGTVASTQSKYNAWDLGARFQEALGHCSAVGAHGIVFELGLLAADLAMARGAYSTPRRIIRLLRHHCAQMRPSPKIDARLAQLEERIATQPLPQPPVPADQLLAYINAHEHANVEEFLDWVFAALQERPDDLSLIRTACSAFGAMKASDEARELLWDFIRRHPADCEEAVDLFIRYTPPAQEEELATLADFLAQPAPRQEKWLRLYQVYRQANAEAVEQRAEAVLQDDPQALGARLIWANSAMTQKKFALAARLRRESAELARAKAYEESEQKNLCWDWLVAATCAEDWTQVRQACAAIGLDVPDGEGPIDAPTEYVRIFYEEEGNRRTTLARRISPVSARIISACWPDQVQRTEDVVVFDPV